MPRSSIMGLIRDAINRVTPEQAKLAKVISHNATYFCHSCEHKKLERLGLKKVWAPDTENSVCRTCIKDQYFTLFNKLCKSF